VNDCIESLRLANKKIAGLEKEAVIAMKQHHDLCWNIAELEKERDETSPLLKKLLYCCEGLRSDYSEENYGDAKNWLPHIDSAYGKYRDEIDDIESLKEGKL
jgi:hypothetical protein